MGQRRAPTRGRPEATTHAAIEQEAFRLFAAQGFGATTLEEIAQAVGVGRRTLFRYYQSKNDIPWGQFDATLTAFRDTLNSQPPDLTLFEAVNRAVVAFNDFPEEAHSAHRERMALILATPELQAHSALRYQDWRGVIAEYVATRLQQEVDDLVPRLIGHVSLALALSAYEAWLDTPGASLTATLEASMVELSGYVSAGLFGTSV